MTDDLPFYSSVDAPNNGAPPPRTCKRHTWTDRTIPASCSRCNRVRDDLRVARGRSARRLGGDQERRVERVYGPRKVGEYGDPVDHLGRDWKWQSKATRDEKPLWLAAVLRPTWRERLPQSITGPLERMAGYAEHLRPVVIRSFVRQGVRPDDYLFVRGWDWPSDQRAAGYWIVPGSDWLDWIGTDDPGRPGDPLTLSEVGA